MARLGIDFGTTNTVVAMHDRGVFAMVNHQAQTGAGMIVQEVFPSSILVEQATGDCWYGLEADRRFAQMGPKDGYAFVHSLKRGLRDYVQGLTLADVHANEGNGDGTATPRPVSTAAVPAQVSELLTGFMKSLAASIRQSQNLDADEPLETVITFPANANGAQRHVTRQAFRNAGFEVLDTLNEPTASAIELADWLQVGGKRKKRGKSGKAGPCGRADDGDPVGAVAVFDLGGGTFDASVVQVNGPDFVVQAAAGIEGLGGDDFDHVMLSMFLDKLKVPAEQISPLTRHALLRQARSQKEAISTGAVKSLFVNPLDFGLDAPPVSIKVAAYEERIAPMLTPAIETLRRVIDDAAKASVSIADPAALTIYLVGGSSKFPLVARMVQEAFAASRVVMSDKPFRSVAMGAAISATDRVSYRDVFARHFGVLRLRDHGQTETFDMVFPAGTPIPRKDEPPLERVTWYRPAHNIGHLRYLECTALGDNGLPADGVRSWSDVLFPYDPQTPLSADLSPEQVVATDAYAEPPVCEVYRCDSDGVITVEVQRPGSCDARAYEIFQA